MRIKAINQIGQLNIRRGR